jgi:hypothetical protein
MNQPEKSSCEDRPDGAPGREGIESFLVVLGLFLAALVWFWITLSRD